MKKYLKLTLFKKIFVIVFCSFLSIEAIGFYLDYIMLLEKNSHEYMGLIDTGAIEKLCHDLASKYNYDYRNSEFEKEWTQAMSSHYQAIMDITGNQIMASMQVVRPEKEGYVIRSLDEQEYQIKDLGEKLLTQIQQYIQSVYRKEEMIRFQILQSQDGKIQYFKIGDIEYNPQGVDASQASSKTILYYWTPQFYYSKYSHTDRPIALAYEEQEKNIEQMILNRKFYSYYLGTIGRVNIYDYYDTEGDLYIIGSYYDEGENFIFVDVCYTGLTKADVLEQTAQFKGVVYILAFFMVLAVSIMISYMLTRRIKKIEKSTRLIANHRFDLQLKEKPQDELGDLSHSINVMSQKLKNTIQQLNQEIERVKQLETLRKDFINQFTHEMKTPLGIINGYSELLEEAQSQQEKEKYIRIINRETEKINELIASMLNLSRLESHKVDLKEEDVDLEDIVTEVVDDYEVLLMKKDVKVSVCAKNTHLQADQELIKTVIQNFMSNAVKHVNEKGVIEIVIDEGLSIYNEGAVIPSENLDTIWYTFVTHDQQGSGLGLAICRSILELHDFEYGVKNRDKGVEFYFKRR